MKAFALDGIVGMAAKRLTKRAIRDIVETVSGELPATFADDAQDLLRSRREAPR